MKRAVKPDFFANFPSLKRAEEANKRGVTEEEQMFYGLAQMAGWEVFKEKSTKLMEEMEIMNENAVANGMSYEELGRNTVVVSLAKGIIRKLINMVEDSKEACERSGGQ